MSRSPDLVLSGGAIYTGDPATPWAEAVAVDEGRILAVGADEEVRTLAGPGTATIELDGRLVVAGFQDAHCHPPPSGLNRLRVDLEHVHALEDYRRIIAAYAREHPDVDWIVGGGWSMDLFPGGAPRKEELDALVPDRPVFLMNRDVHGAWVNSRALEIGGIGKDTADPWDGVIQRDPGTGEPTGTLQEGAAYSFRDRYIPSPSREEWEAAILEAQAYLHSFGITGWQDAWVTPGTLDAYIALATSGRLTARVNASLWWDRHRGTEQAGSFLEQRERGTVGSLRASTVKLMVDGVIEDETAAMLTPYVGSDGGRPDNRGILFIGGQELMEAVDWIHRNGFQAHLHAIGDRAVREALDAIEAAQRAHGRNDARHHIAHLQVVHPEDVPRFGELGVVANLQMLWACMEPQMEQLTVPFLGPQRAGWQYPFADLVRSGARLAAGSDWAVTTPDPLLQIEVAVSRVDPEARDNAPFLPQQRIDLETAFAAFTLGSAYVNHRDDDSGSIEPGKLADLAVLDRNIFEADAGPIGDARVDLTLVAGAVVYERGSVR